jgi:hypothetical protein
MLRERRVILAQLPAKPATATATLLSVGNTFEKLRGMFPALPAMSPILPAMLRTLVNTAE